MRPWSLAFALAVGTAVAAGDQQQPPTFRTGTNVVRVDVTVMDRRGAPLTNLTAEDFEVREDGQPQTITSFKLVEANGQPTDDLSLEIRGPEHAKAEAARDDVRVFLVFWDEYHIEEFRSALYARSGFEKIMMQAFGPTDLVGIMDQLMPTDSIRFTRDRRVLSDQIHKMKGRRRVYVPVRSFVEEEHLRFASRVGGIEVVRGDVTRTAIKAAAAYLGTLKEGRKTLIIISESLGAFRYPEDRSDYLQDVVRAANDANTAIYVFDPRGLMINGNMSDLLATLAYETGGEPIRTNDVVQYFPRLVKQSSAFYLLGYAKEMPQDGKFHQIKVQVKRPGVEVRARSGYWAPRAADVTRAKERAAEAARPPAIAQAFEGIAPTNSRHPVDIWTGLTPGPAGTRVTAAWTARDGIDARMAAGSVTVTATAGDAKVFEGEVKAEGTSFPAPAGPMQLAFMVLDAQGEIVDRVSRTITVPASASALSVTTPTLARSRNPAELKAMISDPQPPVYAGREFARSDRLLLRFGTTGASSAVTLSARLLTGVGSRLVELPVRADATRGGYQIDLPLASVARGEYVIAIDAIDGEQRAESHVAFRVVK